MIKKMRSFKVISVVLAFAMVAGILIPASFNVQGVQADSGITTQSVTTGNYPVNESELTNKSFYYGTYNHFTGDGSNNAALADDSTARPILWDYKGNDGSGTYVALSRYAIEGQLTNGFATAAARSAYVQNWLDGISTLTTAIGGPAKAVFPSNFASAEMNALKPVTVTSNNGTLQGKKFFLPWGQSTGNYNVGQIGASVFWGSNTSTANKIGDGVNYPDTLGGEASFVAQGVDAKVRGNGTGASGVGANGTGAVSYVTRALDPNANPSSNGKYYSWELLTPDYLTASNGQKLDTNGQWFLGTGFRPELSLDISRVVYISQIGTATEPGDGVNFIVGSGWSYDPSNPYDTDSNNYRLVVLNENIASPVLSNAPDRIYITPNGSTSVGSWTLPTAGTHLAYKIIDASGNTVGHGIAPVGATSITVSSGSLPAGDYNVVFWAQKDSTVYQSDEASMQVKIPLTIGSPTATPAPATATPSPTPTSPATPTFPPVMFNHVVTYMYPTTTKTLGEIPLPDGYTWVNPSTVLTDIGDNQGPFPAVYNGPLSNGNTGAEVMVDVKPLSDPLASQPPSVFPTTFVNHVVTYMTPGQSKFLYELPLPDGYSWDSPFTVLDKIANNQGPFAASYSGPYTNNAVTHGTILVDVLPLYNAPSPTPPALITDDHFAYMQGYPEGDFRPEGNMTRAEATVMFARLINQKMNITDMPYLGKFADVKQGSWYTQAVEYMAVLGIVQGRDSTWFDPDAPITRAEFAQLASKFANLSQAVSYFSDVPSSAWYYNAVNSAAAKGWVTGYGDGTFRPLDNIKRDEVVTIVNRMLGRVFDPTFNQSALKQFWDLTSGFWAYGDIMEATNAHDFVINNGVETWTALTPIQ